MRSNVVLPAPFGPSSTTTSPASTVRSTPVSTRTPPKPRTTPSARSGGPTTSAAPTCSGYCASRGGGLRSSRVPRRPRSASLPCPGDGGPGARHPARRSGPRPGSRDRLGAALADGGARRHGIVGAKQNHPVAVRGREHHPLAVDAAELRRLEVRDDDHLATDERRRVIVRPDAGHDLSRLGAEVDAED